MNGVVVVRDEAGLQALVPAWQALWRSLPGASPFASPAWLVPWWRQFGTGAPRVVVRWGGEGRPGSCPGPAHAEGATPALLSLLALYEIDDAHGRRLLPMGVGLSDHLDALGAAEGLLEAVLDGEAACDLPDLAPGAGLLGAALPAGWEETGWIGDPCPVLALPGSFEALLSGVSRGTRRYWQEARKRAGEVRVERAGRDIGVEAALDTLFALHALRWQARDEAGVLADPRVQAFHREAAPGLLAEGALRLEVLRVEGRVAAAHLSLLSEGRLLHYLTGFDPALEAVRPGTLLLGHLIGEAIEEGRRELHFLRGAEGYKYAWGGVDRMNVGRRLRWGT
ncbi:MAG: GNAT family N-acetyltransferase [Janthinobacterium lividum]